MVEVRDETGKPVEGAGPFLGTFARRLEREYPENHQGLSLGQQLVLLRVADAAARMLVDHRAVQFGGRPGDEVLHTAARTVRAPAFGASMVAVDHNRAASGDIALVSIDDQAMRELGRWPWPRSTGSPCIRFRRA